MNIFFIPTGSRHISRPITPCAGKYPVEAVLQVGRLENAATDIDTSIPILW